MCFSQCCNKVKGKPSPATAGSRATLHRFFETPEKPSKEARGTSSLNEDRGTGEAITIAPFEDREEQVRPGVPDDSEIGAKAPIASKSSDLAIFALSMDKERTQKNCTTREIKDKVKGDGIMI